MPPIPQIAPEPGENPEEEAAETPEVENAEAKIEVSCQATDCQFKLGALFDTQVVPETVEV